MTQRGTGKTDTLSLSGFTIRNEGLRADALLSSRTVIFGDNSAISCNNVLISPDLALSSRVDTRLNRTG